MFTNPASSLSPVHSRQQAHLPRGGNLARVNTQNAGHSLFLTQTPDDLAADDANRHEAWASPWVRGTGAATNRHILRCAESRPFPFLEVNDLAHSCFSSLQCGKYLIIILRGGKILHSIGKILPTAGTA